jgi:DNA-binding transcriptional ArsR family regulator
MDKRTIVEMEEALRIAVALADRSRLLILSRLTGGPACVEELAADLGLAASTVSFHVKKLRLAGLVTLRKDQYYSMCLLAPELRTLTVRDLVTFPDPQAGGWTERNEGERAERERTKVLTTFFADGLLTKMPVQISSQLGMPTTVWCAGCWSMRATSSGRRGYTNGRQGRRVWTFASQHRRRPHH